MTPCCFSIISFLIACQYPITKEVQEQMEATIRERRMHHTHNSQPNERFKDPVTDEDLPLVSGDLEFLDAQFCWYLDYFSESELRQLLNSRKQSRKRGENSRTRAKKARSLLLRSIGIDLFLSIAVCVGFCALLVLPGNVSRVVGVMGASLALTAFVFHGLRFQAASRFDEKAQETLETGEKEYFQSMM